MLNSRLSISGLNSINWPLEQSLALWQELGAKWAGVLFTQLGEDINAGLAKITDAGIGVSTIISGGFNLAAPETWDDTRELLHSLIDAAAACNAWSVFFTPGRTTGVTWNEMLDIFAEAVAPSSAYAREKGVRLGFEPSRRPDVSFVNTLRDAIDVSKRTGVGTVVDFGNCWMERDFREVVMRAAPYITLVQVSDMPIGVATGPDQVPVNMRVPFGEGELPLERLLRDIKDTGYAGPLDLELHGPIGELEGYEPVIRRGAKSASELLDKIGF